MKKTSTYCFWICQKRAKEYEQPLEAKKVRKWIPERNSFDDTLILAQWDLFQPSDFKNCKIINLCFVTVFVVIRFSSHRELIWGWERIGIGWFSSSLGPSCWEGRRHIKPLSDFVNIDKTFSGYKSLCLVPHSTREVRGGGKWEHSGLALESSCAPQKQGKDLDFLLLLLTLQLTSHLQARPLKPRAHTWTIPSSSFVSRPLLTSDSSSPNRAPVLVH